MITGAGKHFRDVQELWELHHNIIKHTKSISSEPYLMRLWTCLWLRTINEKAQKGSSDAFSPYHLWLWHMWPPDLPTLWYARRVRTLPLPLHTHSLTLWLRLWIVWCVCVEVKLRVLLVLSKAMKALFLFALLCIVSTFPSGLTGVHSRKISIKYDHQQCLRLNIWALCSVCILRFCLSPLWLRQLVISEEHTEDRCASCKTSLSQEMARTVFTGTFGTL